MTKTTAQVSKLEKAEIIRGLYDAAEEAFVKLHDTRSPSQSASLAFDEIQKVILRARSLGDEDFAQVVEAALHKYIEQISTVHGDNAPNSAHDG